MPAHDLSIQKAKRDSRSGNSILILLRRFDKGLGKTKVNKGTHSSTSNLKFHLQYLAIVLPPTLQVRKARGSR